MVIPFEAEKFNFFLNYRINRLEIDCLFYRLFEAAGLESEKFVFIYEAFCLFLLINDRILIYVIRKSIFLLEFLLVINVFWEIW